MSDAEHAYRMAAQTKWMARPLMCWFHVVEAVRQWTWRHFRLPHRATSTLWNQTIRPDLQLLHHSFSAAEFQTKARALQKRWRELGLHHASEWRDKNGVTHNCCTYLAWWLRERPEWHHGYGIKLPTTNNMCESQMRWTRNELGTAPAAMGQILSFLLAQAEHFGKCEWSASETTSPRRLDWDRARALKAILHTSLVQKVLLAGCTYWICKGRTEWKQDAANVKCRPALTQEEARTALKKWLRVTAGEPVDWELLEDLTKYRFIFLDEQAGATCSCPAFPLDRRCFHSLAVDLSLGRTRVPVEMDDAGLPKTHVGRKRKFGDCYSKQEPAASAMSMAELLGVLKQPRRRRLRRKTTQPAEHL